MRARCATGCAPTGLTPTAVDARADARTRPLQRTRLPRRVAGAADAAARVARPVRDAARPGARGRARAGRRRAGAQARRRDPHAGAGGRIAAGGAVALPPHFLAAVSRADRRGYRDGSAAGSAHAPRRLSRRAARAAAEIRRRADLSGARHRDRRRRDRRSGHLRRAAGRVRLSAEPADAAAAHAGADRDERVLSRHRLAVARVRSQRWR